MATETTASAAPVPGATTATETPKSASEKLHERAAELIAKQNAKSNPEAETPKPEATVDMDPATLERLTKASERERAARKMAADERRKREELEASQGDVAALREAQQLWKSGDKMGALAKLAAVEDPSAEVEDLLKKWIATPGKKEDKPPVTPEDIAAIKAAQEEDKKTLERLTAKEKAENDRAAALLYSEDVRDTKLEDGTTPRWPLASDPANAKEAAAVAIEKANARLLKLGVKEITEELADHLFELAYDEIEANLKKAKETPAEAAATASVRAAVRAAVVPRAGTSPAPAKQYPRTPEGAKERLMDAAKKAVESKGGQWY